MKYKIAVFDLDGTLSNSKEGITKSVQYALNKMNIKENNINKLEHFIGPPLVDEFIKSYNFTIEDAKLATKYYRERYIPIGIYETSLYAGSSELLQELKSNGVKIALATSKPQEMAEEVLKYLNIYNQFDYIMGAEMNGPRQSKTDVLLALFEVMDIKQNDKINVVMIGDTCFDIEGAKNVGIDAIGVSYGFGKSDDMTKSGAVFIAQDVYELNQFLLR